MDFSVNKQLFGDKRQETLVNKTVSIIGLGGVGITTAQILARNGLNLRLVDKERIYDKEMPRLTTFISDDINKFKAKQAKKRLEELNSENKIKTFHEELTKDNVFLLDADVIIDASNNMETSKIVNAFALEKKIPLIFTNHAGKKGNLLVVDRKQHKKGACVCCIEDELKVESVKKEGAYAPTVMMIASLASNAAIKNLLGIENVEQLLKIDTLKTEIRHKTVDKKEDAKFLKATLKKEEIFLILDKEKVNNIRTLIERSSRPYFLFDDDPDGLSSFLILYKITRTGKGVALKGDNLNEEFAQKINDYSPDLVIILDKPKVNQDFLDKIRTQVIWIDHHQAQKPKGVIYLNPREQDENFNIPTSQIAYEIAQDNEWLASLGIIADWCIPPQELIDKTIERYGDIMPAKITSAPDVLFDSPIGKLARVFSFNLKGKDIYKNIKILSRIKTPQELLESQHAQAKVIMKQYQQHQNNYDAVLSSIDINEKDNLLLYQYNDNSNSYTTDLSNELLYKYPDKFIIIARNHNESYKCSLRSGKYEVEPILKKVLETINGSGGGHLHACGALIPEEEFDEFVKLIREETNKVLK